MAKGAANVTSTEALLRVKAALHQFDAAVSDAIEQLQAQSRRAVDWVEERSQYWPAEARRASDAVITARLELERAETTTSADDRRFCYDERKRLEQAKQRQRIAEEKIQAVRKWRGKVRHEVDAFLVHLSKVQRYLETDLVQATAGLERMSQALERYVHGGDIGGSMPKSSPGGAGEGSP